jgi:hypothetical protein
MTLFRLPRDATVEDFLLRRPTTTTTAARA